MLGSFWVNSLQGNYIPPHPPPPTPTAPPRDFPPSHQDNWVPLTDSVPPTVETTKAAQDAAVFDADCFSQRKAFKHEAVLLLVLFLTFSISSFSRVFLGSPK